MRIRVRYVRGNTMLLTVILAEKHSDGTTSPVALDTYDDWKCNVYRNGNIQRWLATGIISGLDENGHILLILPPTLSLGCYSVEVVMRKDNVGRRSFECPVFDVVETNEEADVTYDIIDGMRSADIDLQFQFVEVTSIIGKNAYELWKEIQGNEDKTLQDFIDELEHPVGYVPDTRVFPFRTPIPDNPTIQQGDMIPTVRGLVNFVDSRNVSTFTNDAGYLTEDDISGKADRSTLMSHIANANVHVTVNDRTRWNSKQDAINDLSDIRSGAAKGNTSVQSTDVFPSRTEIPDNPTVQQRDQVATVGGLVDYVGGKGVEQIQSDWNQSDNTKKDYIKNKPSIPAAQVQSDWNQTNTGAVDYIKNKPTIPAAQVQSDWNATTGMGVILNKPTIPDAQVQSDWNQTTTTEPDYIKNKPTIPDVTGKADKATTLAGYGITDAKIVSGVITLGSDTITPLTSHQDLSNYVQKSNTTGLLKNDGTIDISTYATQTWVGQQGFVTDISGKEDKMTIEAASGATLSAQVGKYYTLSSVGTLAITLPAGSGTKVQSIVFYMSTGSSPAVTFSSTDSIVYSDGFSIEASNTYEVNALWNGVAWVIGMIKMQTS